VQARPQWDNGVDVYATLSARFGDADFKRAARRGRAAALPAHWSSHAGRR